MTNTKDYNSFETSFRYLATFSITFLFILIAPLTIFGQAGSVNFSGTWSLNESKSKFGDSQFRMEPTMHVVKHDVNNLTDERTQPSFDGGDMKTTETLTLDGKVCENTGMFDSKKKSIVTWSEDKMSMTISSTLTFDMGGEIREMKSSEIWKLGEDGKSLIVDSTLPTPDGDIKSTLFYDKK